MVIFAPPQKSANQNDAITSDQPVRNENEVGLAHQMTVSEIVRGAGGMIDSVHDFGASEMPIDNNEEFVPASEGESTMTSNFVPLCVAIRIGPHVS